MMYSGKMSVDQVHDVTKIDKWYLSKLANMVECSTAIAAASQHGDHAEIPTLIRIAKEMGFSDAQIAQRWGMRPKDVRAMRNMHGITPAVKQIDTLGAEYPATTNYLYMTYGGRTDDVEFDDKGVLVLGSGTYRIGSSVEFDYCSMKAVRALAAMGKRTIMLNHNPETVSTDYDENDRLYFDELSLERVLDVYQKESAQGVVVSFGGQGPNNIALQLHEEGVDVLGTCPKQIDRCEDRSAYSAMLDKLGIDQPAWLSVFSNESAHQFCEEVSYPVIVRPSYVLSGAAMSVVRDKSELDRLLKEATNVSPDYPVVISKFVEGAFEVDVDAVASDGNLVAYAISEHLERGGVHSGDATLVLPSFRLSNDTKLRMKAASAAIAKELGVSGPFNTQFLVSSDQDWMGVIETNLRASRSVPFVSKATDVDFIELATASIMGEHVPAVAKCDINPKHTTVKSPQFSFQRLLGADPVLGVEMSSTGEVASFGETVEEAYLKSLVSARFDLPKAGSEILVCAREDAHGSLNEAIDSVKSLSDQGFVIVAADDHTRALLSMQSVSSSLSAPTDIGSNRISLLLDLSDRHKDFYGLRRDAVDFSVPVITNHEQVMLFSRAMGSIQDGTHVMGSVQDGTKSYDEYVPE